VADGPLFATLNGNLEFTYNRDGQCAYTVGSDERVTSVAVESVLDHSIYLAVAKGDEDVILRLNEATADRWDGAPSLSDFSGTAYVMKDAVGFAADIACYDKRRLPDDRLDAHWQAGKGRV